MYSWDFHCHYEGAARAVRSAGAGALPARSLGEQGRPGGGSQGQARPRGDRAGLWIGWKAGQRGT